MVSSLFMMAGIYIYIGNTRVSLGILSSFFHLMMCVQTDIYVMHVSVFGSVDLLDFLKQFSLHHF